jgi:hypothetical protein
VVHIKGGFHIISNVLDVRVELPAEITSTIRIDRPSADQVEQIRAVLTPMAGVFANPVSYYEYEWRRIEVDSGARHEPTPLEPAQWRYHIVAFTGVGRESYVFLDAANLISPALDAFAHVHTAGEFGTGQRLGWGGDPIRGVTAYQNLPSTTAEIFDAAALSQLKSTHQKLLGFDRERHRGIARAIDMLQGLKRIPPESELRILMLFAIIEMLLTHNPGDKEIGDSLSHQISTKVPLLSERFNAPLVYDCFDRNAPPEAIWKRLYKYRSGIAHGGSIDFVKELQILKGAENVHRFLKHAVRRLVRHSLDEPDLIDALKPI